MSREVLSPPLLRMDNNRCYRVNLAHEDFRGSGPAAAAKQQQPQQSGYTEQDLYVEDDDEADDEGGCTIEELPHSFKLTMHVAPAFYGGLIGFKGTTKRRIETETQTEIYVPRSREGARNTEDISIKGKARSNVCAARRKINLLVSSLRKRMRPTHFLCVPLNYGEVKQNFTAFKEQVLAANMPGINEHFFQTDTNMHLTLGTCVLLDDAERAKGVELLQGCRAFLADLKTPFDIKVSGLEIMNDDPSAVRVLYARVEAPELQKFADQSLKRFLQSGLSSPEFGRETVKLHMTVMNSRYRKQAQAQSSATADNFDARDILKRFGDYHFGTVQCSEMHLCVMRTPGEMIEFYKITGTLKFNESA